MPQKYLRKLFQVQCRLAQNDFSLKSRLFDLDARDIY